MAISSPEPLQARYAERQLNGSVVAIPYAVTHEQTEVLLTTGFGERDVAGIAKGLGERGLSVAVTRVVYPEDVEPTEESMGTCIAESHRAVIDDLNYRAGRIWGFGITGISNSKGAAEQMRAAIYKPQLWKQLIPVAPMGMNNGFLGADFRSYRRELVDRIQAAGLTGVQSGAEADRRDIGREFMAGLKYAFNSNGISVAERLHELGLLNEILVGEEDEVFKLDELRAGLVPAGPSQLIRPLSDIAHISLNTETGLDNMAAILHAYVPEAILTA